MAVLKTTSPQASPVDPNDLPSKMRPSASARIAFMISNSNVVNYLVYTTFPARIVAEAAPVTLHPRKGEFLDLLASLSESTVHSAWGSITVISATLPDERLPRPKPRIFDGLHDIFSIN